MMDETYTKIGGNKAWIWVAIELSLVVLGSEFISPYTERNILVVVVVSFLNR
jgi:transposase-like protein